MAGIPLQHEKVRYGTLTCRILQDRLEFCICVFSMMGTRTVHNENEGKMVGGWAVWISVA
jgi:hypothetical protein